MKIHKKLIALMLTVAATFSFISVGHALVAGDAMQIEGCLKDDTGSPVADVEVTGDDFVGDSYPAKTDANGHYSIEVKSEGNYRVTVNCAELKMLGYDCINSGAATLTSGSVQLDFIAYPVPPPLLITNNLLPAGTIGAAYRLQLGAKGGRPPYRWRLVGDSTNMPAGLVLNSRGLLSGTPTINNLSAINVQVTDSKAAVTNKVLYITINPNPLLDAPAASPLAAPIK